MSVRVTYPVGDFFKRISTALKTVVDRIPIIVAPDNFAIEALSPDKVVLVLVELPSASFEEYSVNEEVRIVAERDDLVRALRRAGKRDKVSIEYVAGTRELRVKVFNLRMNLEREFVVPISDVAFERVGPIEVDLEVSTSLPSSELATIIKDVTVVGDEMMLHYTGKELKVLAQGDVGSYEAVLRHFQPLSYLEASVSNAMAKYGVEHLKAIVKLISLADECKISFGTDKPLKISFEVPGGGRVFVWIAPRG